MNGRLIIGLCGRAQHGKSTLAKQIQDYYGQDLVEITAFATVGKHMLSAFGLQHDHLWGNNKGTQLQLLGGHTPRHAMQTLCTEWGRKLLYEEIWVDAWERRLWLTSKPVIVVEDVRHAPEIDRLQEMGAYLVEVYRPDLMPKTPWQWFGHLIRQRFAHSSEQLDFGKFDIPRLHNFTVPDALLPGLFEIYPVLRVKPDTKWTRHSDCDGRGWDAE